MSSSTDAPSTETPFRLPELTEGYPLEPKEAKAVEELLEREKREANGGG